MVKLASCYFPTFQGKAENIPLKTNRFNLVVCRQTFQFLKTEKVFASISEILKPGGSFILSLTVPFSDADEDWLYKIHCIKQPLLLKFYTSESLINDIKKSGFSIDDICTLKVRESINRWMKYAPELTQDIQNNVCSLIKNSPRVYRELHKVEVVNDEIFEDWHWIVIKTSCQA